MSAPRFVLRERVREESTYRITGVFRDEFGAAIPGAALSTLHLWLFNEHDGQIINSVDDIDILNVDRGVVDVNGVLTLILEPDDNVILGDELEEEHIAFLRWTYAGGTRAGGQEIALFVRDFEKVS